MRKTTDALLCLSSHALFLREKARAASGAAERTKRSFLFTLRNRRMRQSIGPTTMLLSRKQCCCHGNSNGTLG